MLWIDALQNQYYLITDDFALPAGDLTICTLAGDKKLQVDPRAIVRYEITPEEVTTYLRSELEVAQDQAQNTFKALLNVTALEVQKQNATPGIDTTPSPLIIEALGTTLDELRADPKLLKEKLAAFFGKLGDFALTAVSEDPTQQAAARAQMRGLQEILSKYGIQTDAEVLAEIPDRLRAEYHAPEREKQRQELAMALEQLGVQLEQTASAIAEQLQNSLGQENTTVASVPEHINGLQAFETLGKFLEEDKWYPQQLEDRTIYNMGFEGENGRVVCYAQIRVEYEQFIFYVMAPAKAPENKRSEIAEFIARANYGLRIGNFELDFSDGEIRYKSSLDFEGITLQPALIKNAMYPAVQTMDKYLPGVMAVIYGNTTPADAINNIENAE